MLMTALSLSLFIQGHWTNITLINQDFPLLSLLSILFFFSFKANNSTSVSDGNHIRIHNNASTIDFQFPGSNYTKNTEETCLWLQS